MAADGVSSEALWAFLCARLQRLIHLFEATFSAGQRAAEERNEEAGEHFLLSKSDATRVQRCYREAMFSVEQLWYAPEPSKPSQFARSCCHKYNRMKTRASLARWLQIHVEHPTDLQLSTNFPDERIPMPVSLEVGQQLPDSLG